MEVVVVFPCAPATAMPYFRRMSSASISARGITGIFMLVRFDHFGIVGDDGGRNDHHVRAVDVDRLRGLRKSWRPSFARRSVMAEGLRVGAGNGVAEGEQHFGDAAHADAADAHQVNALENCGS